jgi:uncharacterized protein YbjQ (UPF0145 family)
MVVSTMKYIREKRWGYIAVISGFLAGFVSAYFCILWHLVIFGFNIMYIISPLIAGVVETLIARQKYGKSTGAISALLTFIIINIYGWFLPASVIDPTKEPATLSLITIIAIVLTLQAAFPTLVNYILMVTMVGFVKKIIGILLYIPRKLMGKNVKPEESTGLESTTPGVDEEFLDELPIPLLSIPPADTGEIENYIGMVSGEAVATEKESEGTIEKLTSLIEPVQLGDYDMARAREMAISRMLDEAKEMGANSVIEVLVEYVSMGGLQGSSLIITATGTAVKYK